jgi:hypothetical protein
LCAHSLLMIRGLMVVTINTGYPRQTTSPRKEPVAEHREGCRLGLGHSRSEWLTFRFTKHSPA